MLRPCDLDLSKVLSLKLLILAVCQWIGSVALLSEYLLEHQSLLSLSFKHIKPIIKQLPENTTTV